MTGAACVPGAMAGSCTMRSRWRVSRSRKYSSIRPCALRMAASPPPQAGAGTRCQGAQAAGSSLCCQVAYSRPVLSMANTTKRFWALRAMAALPSAPGRAGSARQGAQPLSMPVRAVQ